MKKCRNYLLIIILLAFSATSSAHAYHMDFEQVSSQSYQELHISFEDGSRYDTSSTNGTINLPNFPGGYSLFTSLNSSSSLSHEIIAQYRGITDSFNPPLNYIATSFACIDSVYQFTAYSDYGNIGPVELSFSGSTMINIHPDSYELNITDSFGNEIYDFGSYITTGKTNLNIGETYSVNLHYQTNPCGVFDVVAFYLNLQASIDPNEQPVPEPTTMLLFGTGIAGLAAVGRRIRS